MMVEFHYKHVGREADETLGSQPSDTGGKGRLARPRFVAEPK
jgi:hypothetical protein